MTKGERRRLRKQARAEGRPLAGELALGRGCTQAQPPHYPAPTGTAEAIGYAADYIRANPLPDTRTFLYYNERVIKPVDIKAITMVLLEQPHIRDSMKQLADHDRGESQCEFTETPKGQRALERWAKNYEEHNGGPDGPEDC